MTNDRKDALARRFLCCLWILLFQNQPAIYAGDASQDFAALVEEKWQHDMRENPLYATSTGDHRYNDRLRKVSLEDCVRRNKAARAFLERLDDIPRDELTNALRNRYDIFRRLLRDNLAEFEFNTHLVPITHRSGFHIEFPELPEQVPLENTKDYEKHLALMRMTILLLCAREFGQNKSCPRP